MKEAADGPIAGSEQLPADTVAAGLWMPIITASLLWSRGSRAPQGPQPQQWLCGRSGLKGDVSDWANLAVTLPAEWPSRPVMVSSQ